MTTRTLIIVVVAAALLVACAIVVRAHGGAGLTGWFQRIHGH